MARIEAQYQTLRAKSVFSRVGSLASLPSTLPLIFSRLYEQQLQRCKEALQELEQGLDVGQQHARPPFFFFFFVYLRFPLNHCARTRISSLFTTSYTNPSGLTFFKAFALYLRPCQ